MINAETFLKNSPFQVTHGTGPSLENTTPELLKFSLQEQYRNRLKELKDDHHDLLNLNLLHSQFLQDSFNSHLQSVLDDGSISFDESTFGSPNSLSSMDSSTVSAADESTLAVGSTNISGSRTLSEASGSTPSISNGSVRPSKPNYLNLKVLIENSVFDTRNINKDSILTLENLQSLKRLIEDKKELKQYLQEKYNVSQQFMISIINEGLNIESKLLVKIIKSNQELQQSLSNIKDELETLTRRLNNHNLACLVLGYVEDIKITSLSNQLAAIKGVPTSVSTAQASPLKDTHNSELTSPSKTGYIFPNAAFDTLFSHIAATAVQRGVVLPEPAPIDSLESRVQWAQDCIDSLVSNLGSSRDNTTSYNATSLYDQSLGDAQSPSSPRQGDKVLMDYKTALNDLRFSHQYLTKEYEYSREQSFKIIQEFRKKNHNLERELAELKSSINSASSSSTANVVSADIAAKDKEISKLKKELNALKIDHLGLKSPVNNSFQQFSPTRNFSDESDEIDEIKSQSSRMSPQPSSGMSNGILRKEFKKIVGSIQDQYEVELEEERMRRRKLEEELELIKGKST